MNLQSLFIFFCFIFIGMAKVISQPQDSLPYIQNTDQLSITDSIVIDSMQRIANKNISTIKPLKPITPGSSKKLISIKKSPGIAVMMSTVIPASGLLYVNYKDWKYWIIHIPITYGVLGYMIWRLTYNLTYYKMTNYAYQALSSGDSTKISLINPQVNAITDINVMRNYRDQFRQGIDMNALFLAIFWGFNMVDAAVEAHLSNFNISKDLSFKFAPIEGLTVPMVAPAFTLCSFQYKWQYKKTYGISLR
ncbi:MAG: DUF5683 domain-containing protein [Chitinophagaceae bacterium]